MSFFVTCTFDLANATRADYSNAYADLDKIGLHKTVVSDSGREVVAPTTMVMGLFTGDSVKAVSEWVIATVKAAFARRGFKSEIFVVASADSRWNASTT